MLYYSHVSNRKLNISSDKYSWIIFPKGEQSKWVECSKGNKCVQPTKPCHKRHSGTGSRNNRTITSFNNDDF